MVSTWRDHPDCPPEWDDEEVWRQKHTCGDCAEYYPCPCGCDRGWCNAMDDYAAKSETCCESCEPRWLR